MTIVYRSITKVGDLFEVGRRRAFYSECERYRYVLEIVWDDKLPAVNFLMLNPSTATEMANDSTVERCERRAREMGYGKLVVTNLFAFRATDPYDMKAQDDPVGPDNDAYIVMVASVAKLVVCGWGTHGGHLGRSGAVVKSLREAGVALHAMGLCKDGEPRHPLYLGYDVKPELWEGGR